MSQSAIQSFQANQKGFEDYSKAALANPQPLSDTTAAEVQNHFRVSRQDVEALRSDLLTESAKTTEMVSNNPTVRAQIASAGTPIGGSKVHGVGALGFQTSIVDGDTLVYENTDGRIFDQNIQVSQVQEATTKDAKVGTWSWEARTRKVGNASEDKSVVEASVYKLLAEESRFREELTLKKIWNEPNPATSVRIMLRMHGPEDLVDEFFDAVWNDLNR